MDQPVKAVRKKAHGRSAVSNGTRLFVENLDERSVWARRYRDLINSIGSDGGGLENLSELRYALVRRAAAIIVEIERLEGRLAMGEAVDIDQLGRLTGHLRRLSETLGLDRAKRDITPSLSDIIRQHQAAPAGKPKAPAATILATGPVSRTRTPFAPDGDSGDELEAAE